jgi:hypothetical protein
MHRRKAVALVVVAVTMAGCSAVSPTGAPILTVENGDDTDYTLTVYAVPDVDDRDGVTFEATTADGERVSVGVAELRDAAGYRNVTLDAENASDQQITVRASTNTSAAINLWEPGDATVYVIDTGTADDSLVGVHVVTCGDRDQEHGITIADGAISDRAATCG